MKYLIVFNGDSNSGGLAKNNLISTQESQPLPQVQILNNNSFVFEDLQIGINNLIGHVGLTENSSHGLELGLSHNANRLGSQVYLCKTGHGGSRMIGWVDRDGFRYQGFLTRITVCKQLLEASGEPYKPVVCLFLGTNDDDAFVTDADWVSGLKIHISHMMDDLPGAIVLFADVPPIHPRISALVKKVVAETANCYFVPMPNPTHDSNHWGYADYKVAATTFGDLMLLHAPLPPTPTPAADRVTAQTNTYADNSKLYGVFGYSNATNTNFSSAAFSLTPTPTPT